MMEPIIPLALSFLGVNQTDLDVLQVKTEFFYNIVQEIHASDACKNYIEPLYGMKDWLLKAPINQFDSVLSNVTSISFAEYENKCTIEFFEHYAGYPPSSQNVTITPDCQMINFIYCIETSRNKLPNHVCPWKRENFTVSDCVQILQNKNLSG